MSPRIRGDILSHKITTMSSAKGKRAGCCSLTSAEVIRVLFLGSHFNPNWQVISCLPTNNIHNSLYLRNTFVLPVPLPRLVIAWLPVADEGPVPFAAVMRFARGIAHGKHKWHGVESKISLKARVKVNSWRNRSRELCLERRWRLNDFIYICTVKNLAFFNGRFQFSFSKIFGRRKPDMLDDALHVKRIGR